MSSFSSSFGVADTADAAGYDIQADGGRDAYVMAL